MKLTQKLIVSLALLSSALAVSSDTIEVEIVDGKIEVLGYTLVPQDPLPDFRNCEECESAHSVTVLKSPDARRTLIISDVHLSNFDAWLIDTESDYSVVRIADKRLGRHFLDSRWLGENSMELSFGGMGYTTSLFVDTSSPSRPIVINNLLRYDATRDVYASFVYDDVAGRSLIEVGKVFSDLESVETFEVQLDNTFLADSLSMFESVQIDGRELTVSYKTEAMDIVHAVFQPHILSVDPP